MRPVLPAEYSALLRGPLRRYYLTTLLGAFGTGLILSLNIIYVHDVRHLSYHFAGWLLGGNALFGLILAPGVGTLTDKLGPTRVMVTGMAVMSGGLWLYAHATTMGSLIVSAALMTFGGSGVWGPNTVLLTRMVSEEQRERAYGLNFMLLNLGIGFGGLVSSSVVTRRHPSTFSHLYSATAVLELCAALVVASLYRHGRASAVTATTSEHPHDDTGGWREVLADKRLRHYVLAALCLLVCGYGSIETGFSLFITHPAHLAVNKVGVIFFFNTTTIVIAQVFSIRWIQGRRRTRLLAVVGALWGFSWLIVAVTSQTTPLVSLVLLCLASSVFALGETLWAPVSPALVNHLAPERLRGRYNAASGLTWGISSLIAPQVTTLFFAARLATVWPLFVAAGAFGGGLLLMTLRRSLSDAEDGLVADDVPGATAGPYDLVG